MSGLDGTSKGLLSVLGVLLIGAMGFLWYSYMYKPAVEDRDAAATTLKGQQKIVSDRRVELQRLQNIKPEEKKKTKEPVAKYILTRTAVPEFPLQQEAMIQLRHVARLSGVTFTEAPTFSAPGSDGASGAPSGGGGDRLVMTAEISAYSSYKELVIFINKVNGVVDTHRSRIYVRGRLMSVPKVSIGSESSGSSSSSGFGSSSGGSDSGGEVKIPKGNISYSLTIEFYSEKGSGGEDAASAAALNSGSGTGDPTLGTDGSGEATDPTAGGSTAPATDPNTDAPLATTPGESTEGLQNGAGGADTSGSTTNVDPNTATAGGATPSNG